MYPRFRRLRFDIWLCLAVSTLISFLPVKILKTVLPHAYTAYTEEHVVPDGEIGGTADNGVHRAQNVEDLLAHDTFTIVSPGIEYCNHGAGYHGNRYFYAVTLPSGERIAASSIWTPCKTAKNLFTAAKPLCLSEKLSMRICLPTHIS